MGLKVFNEFGDSKSSRHSHLSHDEQQCLNLGGNHTIQNHYEKQWCVLISKFR